ncbi:Ubiquitin carboxyl-terminal hydrolase 13, partial [Mucuna pruriens]
IFSLSEKIENINGQYWTLRAEEILEEEKNLGPLDRLIHVYHFMKDAAQNHMQIQNFGDPFLFVVHEGETLLGVKLRIQQKLQVSHAVFSEWKFAFVFHGRPEYLQDSDIVCARFQRRDTYGAWEQYLGLEHIDYAPKRSYAVNQVSEVYNDYFSILQNHHAFEKPAFLFASLGDGGDKTYIDRKSCVSREF